MAILAGVLAVLAGFVLVPWLSRVAQTSMKAQR
jgi:type IV secretory pathway TrbD component